MEQFIHQSAWHSWGSLTAGDAFKPHFFVVIRGRLKETDTETARQLHDQVAAGGQAQAQAAGDLAHVVFLGRQDPREFLAFDIWKEGTNIASFYSNPDFQAAFSQLYEGAPTVGGYRSTDWHQW